MSLEKIIPICICSLLLIYMGYNHLFESFYEVIEVHNVPSATKIYSLAYSSDVPIAGIPETSSDGKRSYIIGTTIDPQHEISSPHNRKDTINAIQSTAVSEEKMKKIKISDKQKQNIIKLTDNQPSVNKSNVKNQLAEKIYNVELIINDIENKMEKIEKKM